MRHKLRLIAPWGLLTALASSVFGPGCPPPGAAAYNRAQDSVLKGSYPQAIGDYQQAIRENPTFAEAHYNLGAAQFRLAQKRLHALMNEHSTPTLRASLARLRSSLAGRFLISAHTLEKVLQGELTKLAPALTRPLIVLLRQSLQTRLRAHRLFRAGHRVFLSQARVREALNRLKQAVELTEALGPSPTRGRLLLALAEPRLVIYVHRHPPR